eukprot:Pompholyxophrys_punicea_v1_NODE_585_length_1648_cov_2.561833.p2 type:complete len:104 gc:universal NODE_585_length_1648_cov_2.561833:575-886(+)
MRSCKARLFSFIFGITILLFFFVTHPIFISILAVTFKTYSKNLIRTCSGLKPNNNAKESEVLPIFSKLFNWEGGSLQTLHVEFERIFKIALTLFPSNMVFQNR